MTMKYAAIPEVTFRIYPRKNAQEWLIRKKKLIERKWVDNKDGRKLLQKIAKECNLVFPSRIVDDGIQVTISRYSSRKHGDSLGETSPTEPNKISLYVRKGDTYANVRSTLCHEMLHSLMWSKYYYDNRRKPVSFFADVFADELITTMFEQAIVRGKLKRADFEWALDNACSETYARLKNLKRTNDYDELLDTLRDFFRECRKSIRRGSDILKERERALDEILSPIPLTLEE
jgi:hypothetical protein